MFDTKSLYVYITSYQNYPLSISHFFIYLYSNALRCSLILKIIITLKHVEPNKNLFTRLLIVIFDTNLYTKITLYQNYPLSISHFVQYSILESSFTIHFSNLKKNKTIEAPHAYYYLIRKFLCQINVYFTHYNIRYKNKTLY